MLEDRLLLKKFKDGSTDALRCIYQKYESYLLTLATALLGDPHAAEDILHDVFYKFIQSRERIALKGNLKGYLGTCVANRARDIIRSANRRTVGLEATETILSDGNGPDQPVIWNEGSRQLTHALAQLPHEQRETIILHIRAEMKLLQIAAMQEVSIHTVKSRYRYGLDKLRILLDHEDYNNEIHREYKTVD